MNETKASQRIDAHHHLWSFNQEEYGWIDTQMAALRRDFLVQDLHAEVRDAGVHGTVAVQARQTVEETDWLLQIAENDSSGTILGVVGWLPLAADDFPRQLARYENRPHLKGLRHVVQAEAPGFLEAPAFHRGISCLRERGLVFDLLIVAEQLPEATAFVDRHPDQPFVLDHVAKPRIRAGEITSWARNIRELARRSNVACKVSGMVTEADPAHWTEAELHPYFEIVLESFGPDRLMVGTDWPVLTLGCGYRQWWAVVERWIAALSPEHQAAILGGTATRVYRLGNTQSEASAEERGRA